MFLSYFLHSSLVNLLLLVSLEERFICGELGCFLGARDKDNLKERFLVDKATRDRFVLFWETVVGLEVKVFSCF